MLADPSNLLSTSSQESVESLAHFLQRWMNISLKVVAVESLNRHQLAQAMSSFPALPLSEVPGVREIEQAIATYLHASTAGAAASSSFRGGLLRSLFPERLGLLHSAAHKTIVVLLAVRERYVYCEYGAGVLGRLAIRPALEVARSVGLAVMDSSSLPSDTVAGGAALVGAAADFVVVDSESRWASALLEAFSSALKTTAVRALMKRGLTFTFVAGIIALLLYRVVLYMRRARRCRAKFSSWLAALERAFPLGAPPPPDADCTICLGSVDIHGNPSSPTSTRAAPAVEGGQFPAATPGLAEQHDEDDDGGDALPISMASSVAHVPAGWIALTCAHKFHALCALQWLHRRNSCPLCRETDPLPDVPTTLPWPLRSWGVSRDVTAGMFAALRSMSAREWLVLLEFAVSEWYTIVTALLSLWRFRDVVLLRRRATPAAVEGLRPPWRFLDGAITASELFA